MIGYYVTVIRAKRVGWLAGPYLVHDDALRRVDFIRRLACELDPWCDFDLFGTARLERDELPAGVLCDAR